MTPVTLYVIWISCTILTVSTQMCQNYGQQCFDHSNCCGGCCRFSVCVDSIHQCSSSGDDCRTIYCPPGLSCSLYQLPGCPGCPIIPYCRLPFPWTGLSKLLKTRTES